MESAAVVRIGALATMFTMLLTTSAAALEWPPEYMACFSDDLNFKGLKSCFVPYVAQQNPELKDTNYGSVHAVRSEDNDTYASVRVGSKITVVAFADADQKGDLIVLSGERKSLGPKWNDRISSMKIEVLPEFMDEVEALVTGKVAIGKLPTLKLPTLKLLPGLIKKPQKADLGPGGIIEPDAGVDEPPPRTKKFIKPEYKGVRLDYCLDGKDGCGQEAAEAWCQDKKLSGVEDFKKSKKLPSDTETIQIGTDEANPNSKVFGFVYIVCLNTI
jgi:hypothetical protein